MVAAISLLDEALRVLLIDDDSAFTALLAEYLVGDGSPASRRPTRARAWIAPLSERLDAVILDVMMPSSLTEWSCCGRLRRETALPVLMLTAKGDSIDRIVGLELGADDYIPKPVHPREAGRAPAGGAAPPAAPEDSGAVRVKSPSALCAWPRPAARAGSGRPSSVSRSSEFDLLLLLARRPGEVLTKDEFLRARPAPPARTLRSQCRRACLRTCARSWRPPWWRGWRSRPPARWAIA